MRKLIVSIHSTANDIVSGSPSGDETELYWAQAGIGESLDSFFASLSGVDTILMGRATHEDLSRRWPGMTDGPDVVRRLAEKVNTTPKLVVTSKREPLTWGDFDPPTPISIDDVEGLKQRDGGEIITFGSPTLVQSLTNAGLVDEYRILVHPVIVHEGKRLFDNLTGRTDLRLLDVERFPGGAMMVTYATV